jgi:cardiolipin synthase
VFVEEFLKDLRRDRFSARALGTYLRRLAGRLRENIDANPGAVRSLWSTALGFFALAFLAAAAIAVAYDRRLAYEFFQHTAVWILLAFAFATALIELLRDRDGYRLSSINVPIALTLLRIALVPGIALFLMDRHFKLALVTFVVAELTDVADGWVARRWNQVTQMGTVLDPLVDIVFNLTLFVGMTLAGLLDGWVLAMATLRYALLLVGGSCMYLFVGPVRIRPTTVGRLTGVIMGVLISFLILLHIESGRWLETLGPLTRVALGLLLSVTVVQVVALGWYNLRVMRGAVTAQGRVVDDVRWAEKARERE